LPWLFLERSSSTCISGLCPASCISRLDALLSWQSEEKTNKKKQQRPPLEMSDAALLLELVSFWFVQLQWMTSCSCCQSVTLVGCCSSSWLHSSPCTTRTRLDCLLPFFVQSTNRIAKRVTRRQQPQRTHYVVPFLCWCFVRSKVCLVQGVSLFSCFDSRNGEKKIEV
jgi:hypothetical protein